MNAQDGLWWVAAGALALAVLAGLLDHRRNLDRVGWAPWSFLQIAAAFAALIAAALAMKG